MEVYLEVGAKRVFACSIEWPGWARSARDEAGALEALVAYGPRYREAVGRKRGLVLPKSARDLRVVERLKGDSSTDFGAPGKIPSHDTRALDTKEVRALQAILRACWRSFDEVVEAARGVQLATGPRGGGRALDAIVAHEREGQLGYLGALGGATKGVRADEVREAFLDALAARARGELPDKGPRGGKRWPAAYGARRSAWHTLDHAWEIQDRSHE